MTKVQAKFTLAEPLDERLMDKISRAHGVYGIHHIRVAPSLDAITVEYDASHLIPTEVESTLHRAGLPIRLYVETPPPAPEPQAPPAAAGGQATRSY